MKRITLLLLINLVVLLYPYAIVSNIRSSIYLTELEKVTQEIDSPQDISKYILNNIKYQQDVYLYEENRFPEETVALGYGDCEDMALLAVKLLGKIGITASTYMIINQSEAHCICIWEEKGSISILNNGHLVEVQSSDLFLAAARIYPDFIYFDRYCS